MIIGYSYFGLIIYETYIKIKFINTINFVLEIAHFTG
jgi:hypothetical protein